MATKQQFTAEQQAEMDSLSMGTDEFEAANTRDELAAGTYKFSVKGGKVNIKTGENVMKDSIEVNLTCRPYDSSGNPTNPNAFFRFTLPMRHGEYVPNELTNQIGLTTLRTLAKAANTSLPTLVEAFKVLQMPVELIGADFVGKLTYKEGKNGGTFSQMSVVTAKDPIMTPFKGKVSSPQAATRSNNVADDSSVPF